MNKKLEFFGEKISLLAAIELITSGFKPPACFQMADGKPPNRFAFNARPRNKSFTLNVLYETHLMWKDLIRSSEYHDFTTYSTQVESW